MDDEPKSIFEAVEQLRKARDELAVTVGRALLDDWRKIKSFLRKWVLGNERG